MKLNDMFPSKWLRAQDLDGRPQLATIADVRLEQVEDGKPPKPVLYFKGLSQGLVLNKTNGQSIGAFLGDDTTQWHGQKVVLYPDRAPFQGKVVDCIRVRAPKQQPAPPPQPVPSPQGADDVEF